MKTIMQMNGITELVKDLKKNDQTIVLVGGCFDVLHLGHLKFLKAAKKQGDTLIVALENDENVKRLKGKNRPVNQEKIRAENLNQTGLVDLVVLLPTLKTGQDYLQMVQTIKPDVIAVTAGDLQLKNKQKQAEIVGCQVKVVIKRLPRLSTSEIIKNTNKTSS